MADTIEGKVLETRSGVLQGAKFVFAGMNFMVDPADLTLESGQCVDICNCDVDHNANVSRRDGFTKYLGSNVTSAWANTTTIYCVVGGAICRVIDDIITPFSNSPIMLDKVEFKQVNNVVVYSDGVTIGLIEGNTLFVFSNTVNFD